jgi:serine/threonine protein kinase
MNEMISVWQVDMEIASALQNPRMTDDIIEEKATFSGCPIIHFGMITFDYDLGIVIGGFSRVFFGYYRKQKVAIKMLYLMELTPESIRSFYKEAEVLVRLQHPHVVECKGIIVSPPAIGVVMEYCRLGSLYTFLYDGSNYKVTIEERASKTVMLEMRSNSHGSVELSLQYQMILDAITALAFMHDKGYMHCDMKSLNYLVTEVCFV